MAVQVKLPLHVTPLADRASPSCQMSPSRDAQGTSRETGPMDTRTQAFDVCVIGSGPAGGILAKELAESGAKVILIEAGPWITAKEFHFHAWPYEFPNHVIPEVGHSTNATERIRYEDSDSISVDTLRAVGGRSIHWNAVCLRFAERDFREKSLEGIEEDWPLTYEELAPYYSHVENMIGVTGSRENLEILPDGVFLAPLKFRCSEKIVKVACDRMGIPFIPTRKALITVPYDGRPACHYCGHCMHGCDVSAIFSTATTMVPKAQKTGNFTLLPSKLAREILVDREGRARAVSIVDTITRKEEEIRARIFAVCGGAIESPRLLLNSRSPRFPNGLANSSGLVGRYLTGHSGAELSGYLEALVGTGPVNNDGATDHAIIPRFNHRDRRRPGYVGGWHYQMNFAGFMFPYQARFLKGFGKGFKQQVRFLQPGFFQLYSVCKCVAQKENYVSVDPARPDAYGIPTPVVRFRFCDNDRKLRKDSIERGKEILNGAKAKPIFGENLEIEGLISHEVGTTRMGNDPRTSVLSSFCQAHDVKNLFVISGSAFTTIPEKNPTHTIMALAVRAARYIASESRRGHSLS
jgi:choline dehydrogenase-like flavoprotein